jgi:hypothetical protein
MFFQIVFASLLIILLGLALCFAGYRFFIIILPIWGFFAGFQFGASILTNLFGQGFLTTVIGWVIGLLVGIFAAVLAYLFYAAAVIVLAALVGYELGVGIMTWIGFKPGFFPFLVGLVFALAIGALAVYLRFPKLLIIILTAFGGAGAILAGFFLALGRIGLDDLKFGEVGAIIRDNWLWGLLYLAIAAVGFAFQWRTTQTFFLEADANGATLAAAGTGGVIVADATTSPAADMAATDMVVTETVVTDTVVADTVVADTVVADTPAADTPMAEAPAASASVSDAPVTDMSTTDVSTTDASTTDAPATDTPATDA